MILLMDQRLGCEAQRGHPGAAFWLRTTLSVEFANAMRVERVPFSTRLARQIGLTRLPAAYS
jgi:hypothetical protein